MTAISGGVLCAQDLQTSDFDYELPVELIAQSPLERRDGSRLLVLDKKSGEIRHSRFSELGRWLEPGDLLVANNSRVIPARLRGTREPAGGAAEVLLLSRSRGVWSALAKPSRRLQVGTRITFRSHVADVDDASAVIEDVLGNGEVKIRFEDGADQRLQDYGVAPLPPYISQPLADDGRYQTVYGSVPGSAAAPTAGLHFTQASMKELRRLGLHWAEVTLHVGLDTFRPVNEPRVMDHRIHREWCHVPQETAHAVAACRQRGGKVVAIGTTSARTLETIGVDWQDANPKGFTGLTGMFILPGHKWTLVDALLTNFHLPKSTLLMLVSALAGRDLIRIAYDEAVHRGYRFYSFGDAMLIR